MTASVLMLGCRAAPAPSAKIESPTPPSPPVVETFETIKPKTGVAGMSVEGRPISYELYGEGERTILIMGGIHGSEPVGKPLSEYLGRYLANHAGLLIGKRIILMPEANPDGMAKKSRLNARGVDLNRNFPAANYVSGSRRGTAALSEPESRAIHHVLDVFRPVLIVAIHQNLDCVDYDGPAEDVARALSQYAGLPVKKLGGRDGSLGSYASTVLNIPVVTLEFPKSATSLSESELWARYGRVMTAAVTFPQEPPPQN